MPELPDVEAQRHVARRYAVGGSVAAVSVQDRQILRNTTPQGLGRALRGATIEGAQRHGKWLWLVTDARSDVLVHFGMTGSFHWHAEDASPCRHDLVRLTMKGGVFAYNATRKLGGVWVVRTDAEREQITGPLGLDALDADEDALRERIGGSSAALKAALMDQTRLAGVGNLLADEVCWQAKVHPATRARDLDDRAWGEVADALAHVLDVGIDVGQVPEEEGFLTRVRDDRDAGCPRCGASLAAGTIAERTSRWCSREQPDPRSGG